MKRQQYRIEESTTFIEWSICAVLARVVWLQRPNTADEKEPIQKPKQANRVPWAPNFP